MRVLIAHNRYRSPGGEETHVDLLERGLGRAGVETRRFERESAELAGSPLRKSAAALTLAYRPGGGGIQRFLREWQPDVVHFHNIWPLLTPAALRAAKRSGAAVVLTAHNYRFACPSGMLLRDGEIHEDCIEGSSLLCGLRGSRSNPLEGVAYGFALELQRRAKMLERWVDAFVAPSAFMKRMLARSRLPAERIHVIPNGIELRPPAVADQPRSVLYVGRLVAEKGVRSLLEAATCCPEVPIATAGDGPLAQDLARAPQANVRLLGRLGRESLRDALDAAAFTVVPSEWYDNLPFAALESLAAGRAVVAARIGGLPEIVDDGRTGVLFPAGDVMALAAALSELWARPRAARAMGERARAVAAERFSLERQTDRLLSLYDDLVSRRPVIRGHA